MGGGKIKDATALPSDVAKGKVFYNNEGRQVGNKDFLEEKVASFSINKSMNYRDINDFGKWGMIAYVEDDGRMYYTALNTYPECRYRLATTLNYKIITYVEINGIRFDISWNNNRSDSVFQIMQSTNLPNAFYGNFMVTFENNKLYFGMDDRSKYENVTFKIHYI